MYSSNFFVGEGSSAARAAEVVVPIIYSTFKPTSVADVGCGTGAWLSKFKDLGVTRIAGFDGDYVPRQLLAIDDKEFHSVDLTRQLPCQQTFDLALCLEVAEHLDPSVERHLVGELVRLAPVVVFSAAVPFQCGNHHVNERWQSHWASLFREHKFRAVDMLRKQIWETDIDPWYIQNTIVYIHQDVPKLRGEPFTDLPLDVIHPRMWESWTNPRLISLKKLLIALSGFPYALMNTLGPRVWQRVHRFRKATNS